jgi:repressor LexA
MTKLTKRQHEILALIQSHMASTGSPPTRAEIAKTMGFRSPNAAEDHLRALARKGAIELVPGTSRGIRLTQHSGLPIIGRLQGKAPLLSEEHIEGTSRLERTLFNPSVDYLIHITDNHLQNHHIINGDYLAVHQTNTLSVGQLGIFRLNSEVVIRLYSSEIQIHNPLIEGLVVGVIRSLVNPNFHSHHA